ncbi:uncharacterized protein LOC108631215 [Ceratina calcarata]|uniref:Uncharacterized protein LOC108631215 n=1 Tax=Ceratina calcarata TaxID=156304 RepID=A0AAJ7JDY4_9HYME|nr:uncharacterized protein LOC108631215 [Ceratina calcarata]
MSTSTCRLIFSARTTNTMEVARLFNNAIDKNNGKRSISGLLLIYTDFIIHLIEGTEDDVLRLCHDAFAIDSTAMTNVKCLYLQSDAKKRFFEKWCWKRMNDDVLNDDASTKLEDNFENATVAFKTMILNLCKLYAELSTIQRSMNHDNFTEHLDLVIVKGNPNVPSKRDVEFVLESRWGYDLVTLVNHYHNLNCASNFDDYSLASEVLQDIHRKITSRVTFQNDRY